MHLANEQLRARFQRFSFARRSRAIQFHQFRDAILVKRDSIRVRPRRGNEDRLTAAGNRVGVGLRGHDDVTGSAVHYIHGCTTAV